MRHRLGLRKLNRTSSHRLAMLRNMTNSLLRHEVIRTTLPKAKELRRVAEPIVVVPGVIVPEAALSVRATRSSGPGGQNVNKVSTAVELRFDVLGSPSLPEGVRVRLARLAGRKLSDEGILIIRADRATPYDLVMRVITEGKAAGYDVVLATATEQK